MAMAEETAIFGRVSPSKETHHPNVEKSGSYNGYDRGRG